jgi:hypothetical protein
MKLRACFRGGDPAERPGWWIGFSYDAGTVELLKRRVPHTERMWDGAARLWWIADAHERVIAETFANFADFKNQLQLL